MSGPRPPAPGDRAPDFDLADQHGQRVRLASVLGDRPVLVVFFPFAFTPVCSGELEAVRDGGLGDEALVLGVSCDPMAALRVFSDQVGATHPLLSDFWPHGAVARAYGVFDEERGCALRGSFLVDGEGLVRWSVVHGAPDARDLAAHRAAVAELVRGRGGPSPETAR